MTKELTEIMREYQHEMREEELRNERLKSEDVQLTKAQLKMYSIQVKVAGSTRQYITVCDFDALSAIDNVIAGLEVAPYYEYIAREVINEKATLGS